MLSRKLTQSTPMIHFQAKEEGVTLRATEVKPKLDRFIYRWCQKNGRVIQDEWLVEGKTKDKSSRHRALDYKLRFVAKGTAQIAEPKSGLFFGNMGAAEEDKRYTIYYKDPIEMKILCLHPDLEKILDECVDLFFLTTNFGTRQDKSFGGFVTEKWQTAEKKLAWWFGSDRVYRMDYPKGTNIDTIMNDVRIIYQVLKSGYNFKQNYIKSFLTQCFLDHKIGGEKRYIKHTGVGPSVGKKPQGSVDDFLYIRGLLGVGDEQMWQNEKTGKTIIRFLCKDETIGRVPSPLLFKIVGTTLYMILVELPDKVYGTKYCFDSGKKTSNAIPIPTKEKLDELELDMKTILQRYVDELNGNGKYGIRNNMSSISRPADKPFFVRALKFNPVN